MRGWLWLARAVVGIGHEHSEKTRKTRTPVSAVAPGYIEGGSEGRSGPISFLGGGSDRFTREIDLRGSRIPVGLEPQVFGFVGQTGRFVLKISMQTVC